ncbi:hypothetical protein PSPO01_14379 [Paraphaeosphaeria sporulosa]
MQPRSYQSHGRFCLQAGGAGGADSQVHQAVLATTLLCSMSAEPQGMYQCSRLLVASRAPGHRGLS